MRTAFRTVRWLLDAALVLLVGSVLALVLAAKVGPLLGHQPLIIRGGSMEPSIPSGSLVDVTPVQAADLAAGDVVTIKAANDVFVTHRVNRVIQLPAGLYIETKGDANEDPDPVPVAVSAVAGRVDFSLPLLGYIMFMLTTLPGMASIICLALTLVLALQLLEDLEDQEGDDLALERRLARLAVGRSLADPPIRRWPEGPTWWPPLPDSTEGRWPSEPPAGRLLEDPELELRLVEPRVGRWPEEPTATRRLAPPAGGLIG